MKTSILAYLASEALEFSAASTSCSGLQGAWARSQLCHLQATSPLWALIFQPPWTSCPQKLASLGLCFLTCEDEDGKFRGSFLLGCTTPPSPLQHLAFPLMAELSSWQSSRIQEAQTSAAVTFSPFLSQKKKKKSFSALRIEAPPSFLLCLRQSDLPANPLYFFFR